MNGPQPKVYRSLRTGESYKYPVKSKMFWVQVLALHICFLTNIA